MGLEETHDAVLDAIKTKIEELITIKSVTIGELTVLSADKYPAAYIIPARDEIEDHTVSRILHKFRTKVVVIVRSASTEPLVGMDTLIALSGDVYDKILEDRTLGGACEILYMISRDFDYSLGKDFNLFWTIITIEPWKAI